MTHLTTRSLVKLAAAAGSLAIIFGLHRGIRSGGAWSGGLWPGLSEVSDHQYLEYGLWSLSARILRQALDPIWSQTLLIGLGLFGIAVLVSWLKPTWRIALRSRWTFALIAVGGIHLLATLLIYGIAGTDSGRNTTRPNILLVVVDTLRADHLGFMGYPKPTSPHLDNFATDTIIFSQALAHAPWTSPSVAALLTSQYPGALGFADSKEPARPDDEVLYLAEILRNQGYPTTAIVSHTYIGSRLGFDQGFERFEESDARGPDYVSSASVTDKAVHFLEGQGEKPFFLLLHYFDPHFAYQLHEEFNFDPDYEGDVQSGESYGKLLQRARNETLSEDDVTFIRALYDSEIRFTDQHLGRLFKHLRDRDLYDDTLIIFTADHGEAFLDRKDRWIGHGKTLFQELIHVPLAIKLPASEGAGTIVNTPVGLIDVVPTLLELFDIPLPNRHRFEGSVLPLNDLDVLSQLPPTPVFSETLARNRWLQSVVEGQWKLILNRETQKLRLFDLAADPLETTNLADREPATTRRLMGALRSWSASVDERRQGAGSPASFTTEEEDRLRALGYLP